MYRFPNEYCCSPSESEFKKWIKMEIERRDEEMLKLKGYRKVVTCAECERDGWCDIKEELMAVGAEDPFCSEGKRK